MFGWCGCCRWLNFILAKESVLNKHHRKLCQLLIQAALGRSVHQDMAHRTQTHHQPLSRLNDFILWCVMTALHQLNRLATREPANGLLPVLCVECYGFERRTSGSYGSSRVCHQQKAYADLQNVLSPWLQLAMSASSVCCAHLPAAAHWLALPGIYGWHLQYCINHLSTLLLQVLLA